MRSVWILALAATGCRSILGIGDPPDRPDAAVFIGCADWHPVGFDPCKLTVTASSLALAAADYTYDTTDISDIRAHGGTLYDAAHAVVLQSEQTIVQSDHSIVAVLAVGQFTTSIATTLTVIGPHPLLLVSGTSIMVNGAIDAGSQLRITNDTAHLAEVKQVGAGANQNCLDNAGHDGGNALGGGSGGGGGGGLRGAGGAGGDGGTASTSVPGGAFGPAGEVSVIRGGCPGGASGAAGTIAKSPATAGTRALGGPGGGALRLVARDLIDVAGTITAGGAGGAGAPTNSSCGGGGGGAGGYLGFDAPAVRLHGIVAANAGGGGSGGTTSETGHDGADGAPGATQAPGGMRPTACPGAGGAGAAGASGDGVAASASLCNDGGGGGGGGASGIIVVHSADFTPGTAVVSPPPTMQ
jgi:hypothetical protein